jgi:hypothetical protein
MRKVPVLVVWGAGLVLAVSCGGDGIPSNRTPFEGGTAVELEAGPAGNEDAGPMPGCPESQPKTGETCGPGVTESTVCEYPIGECVANGTTHVETVINCCYNGVWENCGGQAPCDAFDASLPSTPDARADVPAVPPDVLPAPPDVSAASPDAAVDAAVDVSPDIADDHAPDAGADADADATGAADAPSTPDGP